MKTRLRAKNTRERDSRESSSRVFASTASRLKHTSPVITLLTDFGISDYFVAAMKGVILGVNPNARIVDITHEIPPQDIEAAAFTLLAAWSSFPSGTIHVAVVDPGVGSARRAILIKLADQFFVGPDNGIFSYVFETGEARGEKPKLFQLTNEKYWRQPLSATFHGRDVFAPVSAALSLGVKPAQLGKPLPDIVRLQPLRPTRSRDGSLNGRIINLDRFGNCITNISERDLTAKMIAAGAALRVKGKTVSSFRNHFAEETAGKEKLFAIWGSAGFLEIAATNASAAKLLRAQRGDAVIVKASLTCHT